MVKALALDCVSKRFGTCVALSEVSLQIEEGAFLGLVGRNGAGKTTAINLITGLISPTEGRVSVLGFDLEKDALEVKRRIGVMPEDGGFLGHLTGRQFLRFAGRMHGVPEDEIQSRTDELFSTLELHPKQGTLLCEYSYGMRKKVALSAALLHGPKVVLLDEPFEGIDPVAGATIFNLLESLHRKGVTLVMTSHHLDIVEKLCPLVAILDQGRLLGCGSISELQAQLGAESGLRELFIELMGGARSGELSWL